MKLKDKVICRRYRAREYYKEQVWKCSEFKELAYSIRNKQEDKGLLDKQDL